MLARSSHVTLVPSIPRWPFSYWEKIVSSRAEQIWAAYRPCCFLGMILCQVLHLLELKESERTASGEQLQVVVRPRVSVTTFTQV